jgi:hypothetical protein
MRFGRGDRLFHDIRSIRLFLPEPIKDGRYLQIRHRCLLMTSHEEGDGERCEHAEKESAADPQRATGHCHVQAEWSQDAAENLVPRLAAAPADMLLAIRIVAIADVEPTRGDLPDREF